MSVAVRRPRPPRLRAHTVSKQQPAAQRAHSLQPLPLSAPVITWQPLTRRAAQFAREVYRVWSARVGSISRPLPVDQLLSLLNDMQLYPSQSQVCEMLQCAQDCSELSTPSQLSFGEFCLFATELKRCYHRGGARSNQFARKLEKDGKDKRKRSKKMGARSNQFARKLEKDGKDKRKRSKKMSISEVRENGEDQRAVFLGGSCNPTTWRHDVAIPLLQSLGISFYNPQVEEWSMELVELEHQAKQKASVLLYVIDSSTRNVVSMIEAAAFAGAKRQLVLVINPYKPVQTIAGETVSLTEYKELTESLLVLQDLAERQDIPVFNSIPLAIKCIAKILQEDGKAPVNNGHIQMAERLVKLREAFNKRDPTGSGYISLADVSMAYKLMTNRKLSISELRGLVAGSSDCKETPVQVNFDEFCTIIAELKSGDNQNNNNNGCSEKWALCGKPLRRLSVNGCTVRDVLLAGDVTDYTWAANIAIPSLKRHNLSYYTVSEDALPNFAAVDNSFVLLFVITNLSRGQAVMTMAAHYIGLGCNVVLCIQQLPADQVLAGEKLSKQAVNDYNRGRIYLKDLARRENIPIFASVEEAVTCVIERCENR